jgi:formylglycine-generating enzyme required for sulfatase activity
VWEWVSDWYDEDYYSTSPENNPEGPTDADYYSTSPADNPKLMSGNFRVFRGGSWDNSGEILRVSCRGRFYPDFSNLIIGFRCYLREVP